MFTLDHETGVYVDLHSVYRKIPCIENPEQSWLIKLNCLNVSDHCYFDSKHPRSMGYGGSRMGFRLMDGSLHVVKGPSHGSPLSMFEDTGVDVRNFCLTKITLHEAVPVIKSVMRHRKESGRLHWARWPTIVYERGQLMYEEKDYVLGRHMRGEALAHEICNTLKKNVFLKSESNGGSSSSLVTANSTIHPLTYVM